MKTVTNFYAVHSQNTENVQTIAQIEVKSLSLLNSSKLSIRRELQTTSISLPLSHN